MTWFGEGGAIPRIGRRLGPFFPLGALLLSFLISLIGVNTSQGRERYLLTFPGDIQVEKGVELRSVRKFSSREERLKTFVSEVLLGPMDIKLAPLFPRETLLRSLLLRGGTLYIDFEPSLLLAEGDLRESFRYLERNIRYNFRGIQKIQFLIGGQIPYQFPSK